MIVTKKISSNSSRVAQYNKDLYILTRLRSDTAHKTDGVLQACHFSFLCREFSKVYKLYRGHRLVMKYLRGDSPLQFWLGDHSNNVLKIYLDGLKQKIIQGLLQPVDYNPDIGELIIGCSDTKTVFRGYVLHKERQNIIILDIDTGALNIITTKDSWKIDNDFFSLPPQAIHCKLWQISDCIKWGRFLETIFKKLHECCLTVVIKDILFDTIYPCFVVDVKATNIGGFIIDMSDWAKQALQRIEIAELFNFTHVHTLFSDLDIYIDKEKKNSFNRAITFNPQIRKQGTEEHTERKQNTRHDMIYTVLYCSVKKGSIFWTSIFLDVGTPWNFYLNLGPKELVEKLRKMISERANNGLLSRFRAAPQIGNFAIGKCFDKFFRVRVTGFFRLNKFGDITAIDIDDGTTKLLWAKDLWVLEEEFLSPPAMSLNCALSDFIYKPPYWNSNLQQMFKEIMTKGIMKVHVSDIKYISGSFRYIVDIKIFGDSSYNVTKCLLERYDCFVQSYKKLSLWSD